MLLKERAQFEPGPDGKPGGNSVEAGVSIMLERMQSRSLRVFAHLSDWFDEYRLYHRKDGIIVKEDDDVISATRYGIMMLRKAKPLAEIGQVANQRGLHNFPLLPPFVAFDPTTGY